jgi:hypothetical protein
VSRTLAKRSEKPTREFFKPSKMKEVFNEDVFMGKLLTWIIKTDQPFSVVDNMYFEDLLDYLRKDITVKSRRTIMRRMEELHVQKKDELKIKLNSYISKFSVT